jgi:hypothetical protein
MLERFRHCCFCSRRASQPFGQSHVFGPTGMEIIMKHFICAFVARGTLGLASPSVSAADLGGYEERETYVERPAQIIERERIVERHYYEPRYYYDEPEAYYAPRPRVYRYYAAEYPYYYGPRFFYRHHWRGHYGRW